MIPEHDSLFNSTLQVPICATSLVGVIIKWLHPSRSLVLLARSMTCRKLIRGQHLTGESIDIGGFELILPSFYNSEESLSDLCCYLDVANDEVSPPLSWPIKRVHARPRPHGLPFASIIMPHYQSRPPPPRRQHKAKARVVGERHERSSQLLA